MTASRAIRVVRGLLANKNGLRLASAYYCAQLHGPSIPEYAGDGAGRTGGA